MFAMLHKSVSTALSFFVEICSHLDDRFGWEDRNQLFLWSIFAWTWFYVLTKLVCFTSQVYQHGLPFFLEIYSLFWMIDLVEKIQVSYSFGVFSQWTWFYVLTEHVRYASQVYQHGLSLFSQEIQFISDDRFGWEDPSQLYLLGISA